MSARPPYHPDFDALSEAVVQADALADSGAMDVLQLVAEVADPETAAYFAANRGGMIAKAVGTNDLRTATAMGGAWLDGLLAGYKLRQAHEKQDATLRHLVGPLDCGYCGWSAPDEEALAAHLNLRHSREANG